MHLQEQSDQLLVPVESTLSGVCSFNEWDQLEEVIVGRLDGAAVPDWEIAVAATMPSSQEQYFRANYGAEFGSKYLEKAIEELETFSSMLSARGIRVRRPEAPDKKIEYSTPNWRVRGGLYSAMPRDSLLVVGDCIIEAPMSWRSRYFECDAFKPLLKEYFHNGARWISAPKPELIDNSFNVDYDDTTPYLTDRYAVTEFEPLFDAADFIRCGKDIFVQKSHVTNSFGIEWVRRHIGDEYQVHVVPVTDSAPMHIDATLMPLAPGKLLVNQKRLPVIPDLFKDWEVRFCPEPNLSPSHTLYMSSSWLSMNVLMLDPNTVVVEKDEHDLQEMLHNWGFDLMLVDFKNVMRFGGAFHCVTADVRRKGILQSYF